MSNQYYFSTANSCLVSVTQCKKSVVNCYYYVNPLKCPSSNNTRRIMKTVTLTLTEAELETIAAAMEDYRDYDGEIDEENLIGGLPVMERVNSINAKIMTAWKTTF